MVEITLLRDAHKVALTGGGETALHSHASGGGALSYTEKMQEITPSAVGWQTYSLSGYGVPSNAVCEFVLSNDNVGVEYEAGIRAKGSSLERRFDLQEAEAGGRTFVTVHVKADVNSQVEGYAENTTNVRFILIGYWS